MSRDIEELIRVLGELCGALDHPADSARPTLVQTLDLWINCICDSVSNDDSGRRRIILLAYIYDKIKIIKLNKAKH